jgi:hypothetical protein
MEPKVIFECENCGKRIESETAAGLAAECCGQPMKQAESLPACEISDTAEHARADNMGEPCDDGRSGGITS